MTTYYRPLIRSEETRPEAAVFVGGSGYWCSEVVAETRAGTRDVVSVRDMPEDVLANITTPRAPLAGLDMTRPNLMGILNVTPDSFSDGGKYLKPDHAIAQAQAMTNAGADIIDVGGESTRPGADHVDVDQEIYRVKGPISAIAEAARVPISIDTRKAQVATAALDAGAHLVNDVSGFTFDPDLAKLCATRQVPVCVMHAQGDPQTMQDDPQYDDVRFDVFDFLAERVAYLEKLGLTRSQILVDPGIGFGKTVDHNLALLRDIALFHTLGCPILLGASRKRFIGVISGADIADTRMPGSVSVALHGVSQAVQVVRVHDVAETRQALALWQAIQFGGR